MKKFFSILMIALLIHFPIVKASSLRDETDNLKSQIDTDVRELNDALSGLNDYLRNNKNTIAETLTIENLKVIASYLHADDYNSAFSALENLLNHPDLSNLRMSSKINQYFALKTRLLQFVRNNQSTLRVDSDSDEGMECALELIDKLQSSFQLIKPTISNLTLSIGDVFVEMMKLKINENSNIEITEYNALIEEYEELASLLGSIITKYMSSLEAYSEIFEITGGADGLFDMAFNNFIKKFNTDLNSTFDSVKSKIKTPIDTFVANRRTILENKVDDIISSNKTDEEKNSEIYAKIDQVTAVNDKFVSAINSIIGSLNVESIRDRISALLERANSEFADAKDYLRNHLININNGYDVNLVPTHEEEISIDRTNEIIILDKLFDINEFKRQLELASNLGTLSFSFGNHENVPNKAKVMVTDNNQVQKEYQVIVKGDINGSGSITVTDVVLAANYSLEAIELDRFEQMAADANSNNAVTVTDVYLIAMKALN